MQAKNKTEASTTPANDGLPRLARRYQAHNPEAGRNASSTVLLRAVIPQSTPNSSQGLRPSRSSRASVSQKIVAINRADRLVSHTQRVHQYITCGSSVQVQAAPMATFSEKIQRAVRKIGMHVSAEKRLLRLSNTNADAGEYVPKMRNTPPMR